MFLHIKKLGLTVTAISMAAGFVLSTPALAANTDRCGQVPQVEWWGNTTHEKMKAYVQKRHDGQWGDYISKWENYLLKMQKGLAEGKSARIPKTGRTLKGRELSLLIQKIEERVKVMRCIEKIEMGYARETNTQQAVEEKATKEDDLFAGGLNDFDKKSAPEPAPQPKAAARNTPSQPKALNPNLNPALARPGVAPASQAPQQATETATLETGAGQPETNAQKRQRKQLYFRKVN